MFKYEQKSLSFAYPSKFNPMATLKLTLFLAKQLKDGRHKIRIAICHKRDTRSSSLTSLLIPLHSSAMGRWCAGRMRPL